jgi:hypothetical protein
VRWPGLRVLGLAVLCGLAGCRAAAAPKKSAPSATLTQSMPQTWFAGAVERDLADVADVRELTLSQASVLVGSLKAGPSGAAQVAAVLGARCAQGFCSHDVLSLDAHGIGFLTVLDLAAPPARLPLGREPGAPQAERFERPALLLTARSKLDGPMGPVESHEILLVAVESRTLRVLLREPSAMQPSTGDGFETTEIQFGAASELPDITLLQHSLPAPGDQALPGPPLTVKLRAANGTYRR